MKKSAGKRKIKIGRVIVIILVIIGGWTVLDNVLRLGTELGQGITRVVQNHRWNMVVIK